MAPQKQQRLLNKCPEIIVAISGRLWDLISEVSTSCIISCTDSLSFRDLKQSTHTCTCRYVSHEINCPVHEFGFPMSCKFFPFVKRRKK